MPRWRVQRDYQGHVGGVNYTLQAGVVLDFSLADAALINADQPGTLQRDDPAMATVEPGAGQELTGAQVETHALDTSPRDRMARKAPKKRGAK